MNLSSDDLSKIEFAAAAARTSGHTQWVAQVIEVDTIDPLACYARCEAEDRFVWERCESGEAFVAWGRIDEIESAGSERFGDVEAWASDIGSRLHWLGAQRPTRSPLFVGGFGFEEDGASASQWKAFPSARFVLPAAIAEAGERQNRISLLARVEPGASASAVESELVRRRLEAEAFNRMPLGEDATSETLDAGALKNADWPAGPEYRVRSDRPHAVFRAQVDLALEAIQAGSLEKAVLARSLRVDHDGPVDIPGFLGRLRSLYPSCTLVAMARGDDTFLAATPETLIRVRGDQIETSALAGSAPRGRTPKEDAELAAALRTSAKERAEHAFVVDALRSVLGPRCVDLEIPATPGLRQLFGIQHLETPVSGRLRSTEAHGVSSLQRSHLLALVSALHPTPAVGGVPANLSREWLRRNEGLDRGWYASPVGWLDAEGGGDFCVALRSALIHCANVQSSERGVSHAWLYAGAGIVEGSEPNQELAETRVKLRALLAPLTEI